MLTNHYSIDEEKSVSAFLKEMNEKKNIHYIILDTNPKSLVDSRTLALKINNREEKLKTLKKTLPWTSATDKLEILNFLIESGESIVESQEGYFDFINALEEILNSNSEILKIKLNEIAPREIYALNSTDSIADAKRLFIQKKINILPVINNLEVIGEIRINDLLASKLFEKNENKDYYSENHEKSVFNLGVENLMNSKPHLINFHSNLKEVIQLMIQKKLPSLIVTKENQVYSIVSFKDIFKIYKKNNQKQEFEINIIGEEILFEDELSLVRGFALKTMQKISKISHYKNLKISYKNHGNKDDSHMRKGEMKLTLDDGGKVLNVSKDISTGTSDEHFNNKVKTKWNLAKMTQEALKTLEQKVIDEKNKK